MTAAYASVRSLTMSYNDSCIRKPMTIVQYVSHVLLPLFPLLVEGELHSKWGPHIATFLVLIL